MVASIRRRIFKRYENSNPVFKKGNYKPTYAEAVDRKQTPYQRDNRSVNEYVQSGQHNERRSTPNGAKTHTRLEDLVNTSIRKDNKIESLRQNHL